MKKAFLSLLLFSSIYYANAQDAGSDKVKANISADIVSQYVWRGQKMTDLSVQPSLGLEYKGVAFGVWGSTPLSNWSDTKELDLILTYQIARFNVGITDYWFDQPNSKYFVYKDGETSHVFEANVGYDFGPLSLQWFTNFAGNDGMNKSGKRAYSSYVEIAAPFGLGGLDWIAAVGAVPYATTFYSDANGFAVVNVSIAATKEIKITDSFSLPLWAKFIANPSNETAAFVVGLTLRP